MPLKSTACLLLILLAVFELCGGSLSQPIVLDSPNPAAGGHFGRDIDCGDVNGDGRADIVVGAPGEGHVHVFDGQTRRLIQTLSSPTGSPGAFGIEVDAVDVTGDRRADIIVGSPEEAVGSNSNQGRVYVFDGSSQRLLYPLDDTNPLSSSHFGSSVCGADVNGDGAQEIIVGAPAHCMQASRLVCCGQVFIFDGRTGALIRTISPPNPESAGSFGYALAAGDVNGDGRAEIVVGDPYHGRGKVHIFNGRTGALIRTLESPSTQSGSLFGSALNTSDIDGDGDMEILVGAPLESSEGVSGQGKVYVFSSSGGLLRALTTPNPNLECQWGSECNRFGVAVIGANIHSEFGCGRAEIIVGANAEPSGNHTACVLDRGCYPLQYQGRAHVFARCFLAGYAFPQYKLLSTIERPISMEDHHRIFGTSLAAGDIDGDGRTDVIVGAPYEDVRTDQRRVIDQGRVYIFRSPLAQGRVCEIPPNMINVHRPESYVDLPGPPIPSV
jgi:outer membrane protein assembly factor BamB